MINDGTYEPTTNDVKLVNDAWKNVTCRHYRDPHTACVECQSRQVLQALHAAGRLAP